MNDATAQKIHDLMTDRLEAIGAGDREKATSCANEIASLIITPPWGADEMPDPTDYTKEEQEIAAGLHLMYPFQDYHLNWTLPYARTALECKNFLDLNDTEGYVK